MCFWGSELFISLYLYTGLVLDKVREFEEGDVASEMGSVLWWAQHSQLSLLLNVRVGLLYFYGVDKANV